LIVIQGVAPRTAIFICCTDKIISKVRVRTILLIVDWVHHCIGLSQIVMARWHCIAG